MEFAQDGNTEEWMHVTLPGLRRAGEHGGAA